MNLLLLLVAHNRSCLNDTGHTYRLRGTNGTVFQLRNSKIVNSIGLCIRIDEIDYRSQYGKSAQDKAEWQTLAPSRQGLFFFLWHTYISLHVATFQIGPYVWPINWPLHWCDGRLEQSVEERT